MKKPPSQVAPSQSRFSLRLKKDTHRSQSNKLEDLKACLPVYLAFFHGDAIRRQTENSLTLHCPFHEDRTPSFVADDKKGVWLFKCFSCGRAGSIIDFHAEKMGLNPASFEAIQVTAESVGVELEQSNTLALGEGEKWARKKQLARERICQVEQEKQEQRTLTSHQRKNISKKLDPYLSGDWKADLFYSSPIRVENQSLVGLTFLEVLFPPQAFLWMGEPCQTGQARHRANFKTCREWLALGSLPPRIAGGHFREGSFSRSKENVIAHPFIVIESDDLIGKKPVTDEEKRQNKVLSHALAGYCQEELGLHLRAVIDTGNKSLHIWFDRPPEAALAAVKVLAPGLRIDVGLLESCSSAPLRMPGCIHEKTNVPATLYYLDQSAS